MAFGNFMPQKLIQVRRIAIFQEVPVSQKLALLERNKELYIYRKTYIWNLANSFGEMSEVVRIFNLV